MLLGRVWEATPFGRALYFAQVSLAWPRPCKVVSSGLMSPETRALFFPLFALPVVHSSLQFIQPFPSHCVC